MTFSIIGTGNIAWFLSNSLVSARHHCTGIYGRDLESARILASHLLVDKYGLISEIEDGNADVCFLAVSDKGISEVAAQIRFHHTVLVHTAGAVSIDEIKPCAPDIAILWPVFSILKNNPPGHRDIPCAWEAATPKSKRIVLEMGHALSDVLFEAAFEQRKWLHLSAVIGNNFINHLLTICEHICVENKIPFSMLMPIIEQTFERIKHASPSRLQTGPAVRNDQATLKSQEKLLEKHPEWQHIYKVITDSIQSEHPNK